MAFAVFRFVLVRQMPRRLFSLLLFLLQLLLALCLFHHSLHARLELAFLLRLILALDVVGCHTGTHLFLAGELANQYHLQHRDAQRHEVIEVECRRLAIEQEQHHKRHEIHHELHARHIHRAAVDAHSVPCVEELHAEHQQAEERHMVAIERNIEA